MAKEDNESKAKIGDQIIGRAEPVDSQENVEAARTRKRGPADDREKPTEVPPSALAEKEGPLSTVATGVQQAVIV